MTEQEQKELGIFGLNWLGLERLPNSDEWKFQFHGINWLLKPENLFDDDFAPILAHLAKRKMEEVGYEWCGTAGVCKKYRYYIMDDRGKLSDVIDENEYIALWLAIREAVKE